MLLYLFIYLFIVFALIYLFIYCIFRFILFVQSYHLFIYFVIIIRVSIMYYYYFFFGGGGEWQLRENLLTGHGMDSKCGCLHFLCGGRREVVNAGTDLTLPIMKTILAKSQMCPNVHELASTGVDAFACILF